MVQVELEPELESMVRNAASEKHVIESFFISQVVERWFEDREDYASDMQVLRDRKHTISQEEMEALSNAAD